jgi:hypothetical protein
MPEVAPQIMELRFSDRTEKHILERHGKALSCETIKRAVEWPSACVEARELKDSQRGSRLMVIVIDEWGRRLKVLTRPVDRSSGIYLLLTAWVVKPPSRRS